MGERNQRSLVTWSDAVVVTLAVALVSMLYVRQWGGGESAVHLQIHVARTAAQHLSLAEARALDVQGSLGVSRIQVADRGARFVASPCSQKICIHTGWLRHAGDTAACLPNGVSMRIVGGRQFDSINF